MRAQRKWIRMLRNNWKRFRRRHLLLIFSLLAIVTWFVVASKESAVFPSHCDPIDVVYTWVNGSDAAFIESIRRYNPSYDPARFDDKNELRYSLRSLEKYAPWIHHVYIITNGQIPHWLDLSFEKVTVVPHEVLVPKPELLPTFSSSSIETFIHRIPHLSQRFLYLNDDIFLGAPLYPEDLYTKSEGVRIYQAWMVPDCAEDCPWTYIGDGACDRHCNIAKCQYDGGDCSSFGTDKEENTVENDIDMNKNPRNIKPKQGNLTTHVDIRHFPLRKKFRNKHHSAQRNGSLFRELVRHKNLSTLAELRRIVDNYNNQMKSNFYTKEQDLSTSTPKTINKSSEQIGKISKNEFSKDIYSHSLIHTNMLLNHHYGFKARNVIAHVGFLLDRYIVDAMQEKFSKEVDITVSNRFRSANDLQFAFTYYSFLMSETITLTVGQIFDEYDTDGSHTWSDREVRTFLARMYPLPLDWSAVRYFEEVVSNCSRDLDEDTHKTYKEYSTLVYERYEDSNVPTITKELVEHCHLLAEALEANFATRARYKYNINPKRAIHNNFMMITSNVSDVVDGFDKIRRNPRKFNCINDNLEPHLTENNELIRHLLEDFYLSFFPQRSRFELQYEYRNRFTSWREYQRWRRRKRAAIVVGYGATAILIFLIIKFLCIHKAKFVRRYVHNL
ncbi:N-acetylglucosamine-1-phosphotransferase subunits alpha/beta [Ceratitis capitata]|uniref:N-acetylglucosamine-1-phosphotransferase subunits alpha/beta n=1 Tax=Ceratitis capitata TaxID=7213 RepID=UPI0003298F94|nr:N-acetylglucosamine-1-phosphotransferase subunits alpha/beta [Ceratitis capitata]